MSAPRWAVGMRRIGPGIYARESDKSLHVCGEELCAHFGVPPTRANMDIAEKAARDAVYRQWPGARIKVVDADPR